MQQHISVYPVSKRCVFEMLKPFGVRVWRCLIYLSLSASIIVVILSNASFLALFSTLSMMVNYESLLKS